jgi:diguanylate cyclase (GGDEF)-like protein
MNETVSQSVFLVAPRHATLLYPLLATSGYAVQLANINNAVDEFAQSPARMILIDCRGALEAAIVLITRLGELARVRGAVLVVLLQKRESDSLPRLFRAGATHFLSAPFSDTDLIETLRFADRLSDRLARSDVLVSQEAATPNLQFDPLTGLANETLLRDWLRQVLVEGAAEPAAALLVVGLSRFERINAAHGRQVADNVLRAVARRLRRITQPTFNMQMGLGADRLLARLPGAEFAIGVAQPGNLQAVVFLAQQISGCFERPFAVDGIMIQMSCRVGLTVSDSESGVEPSALFKQGAVALANARTQDPNSFSVYVAGGVDTHQRDVDLEMELRAAIQADKLRLSYQPQVNILTGKLSGFEVLVRWDHPTLGALNPNAFLDVAASADLLPMLGQGVLKAALQQAGTWRGTPLENLRISVNVAAAQLKNAKFDQDVRAVLEGTGFPAEQLTLEITESALVEDIEAAADLLSKLRRMGVRLALDDFGTGHASYAYLKALPFDYLKLDKAFITGLDRDRRDRALVKSIIELARTLGMQVVAEGVETDRQLQRLSREGCTAYQGYLCSPPLDADALIPFTKSWQARSL